MAIERAFGIYVARWRFLSKCVYIKNTGDIRSIITACCILHNLCIDMNDPVLDLRETLPRQRVVPETPDHSFNSEDHAEGVIRRDNLNHFIRRRRP